MKLKPGFVTVGVLFFSLCLAANEKMDFVQMLGLNFGAPTIFGKENVANPVKGEIIFDDSDDRFYGNTKGTVDGWTVFGAPAYALIGAASGRKTPVQSGHFHSLSGNELMLTAGKWRLFGNLHLGNSGFSPSYTQASVGWYSANGDDSERNPRALSTESDLLVLSFGQTYSLQLVPPSSGTVAAPMTIVECVARTCKIYLVSYSVQAVSDHARLSVSLNAEKVSE